MGFTESMENIAPLVWEALRTTQPELASKELREKLYKNINMCHSPRTSCNGNRAVTNATSWSKYAVRIESH